MLKTLKRRARQEYNKLEKENEHLIKSNEEYEKANEKLRLDIDLLICRIDLNNLLKEIDPEDLKII